MINETLINIDSEAIDNLTLQKVKIKAVWMYTVCMLVEKKSSSDLVRYILKTKYGHSDETVARVFLNEKNEIVVNPTRDKSQAGFRARSIPDAAILLRGAMGKMK